MSKILAYIILFLCIVLLNVESQDNIEDIGKIYDDFNDKYKKDFETNVIKYLKDNYLYKNELVIVDKKAFRSIFKEIMSRGESKVFDAFKKIYNKVCEEIIKDAYPKKKKHIKATELDKYFEYDYVMEKFNSYISKNKINIGDL